MASEHHSMIEPRAACFFCQSKGWATCFCTALERARADQLEFSYTLGWIEHGQQLWGSGQGWDPINGFAPIGSQLAAELEREHRHALAMEERMYGGLWP